MMTLWAVWQKESLAGFVAQDPRWELFKYIFKEKESHGKGWAQQAFSLPSLPVSLSPACLNEVSSDAGMGALKTLQKHIVILGVRATNSTTWQKLFSPRKMGLAPHSMQGRKAQKVGVCCLH